jgi:hypothetical protein
MHPYVYESNTAAQNKKGATTVPIDTKGIDSTVSYSPYVMEAAQNQKDSVAIDTKGIAIDTTITAQN